MKLRLSWIDPVSQRHRRPLLSAPIALGQAFAAMPEQISGQSVSRMVVGDRQIRDFQALIVEVEGDLYLIDNGGETYVNQQQVNGQELLKHGDRIRIGQTELQLQIMDAPPSSPSQRSTHLQAIPEPAIEPEPRQSNGHYAVAQPNSLPPLNAPSPSSAKPEQNSGNFPSSQALSSSQGMNLNGNAPAQTDQSARPQQSAPEAPPQFPTPLNDSHLGQANSQPVVPAPTADPASPYPKATTQASPEQPSSPQPLTLHNSAPNPGCRRMVGFLFKRPCGRTDSSSCDHCANGGYSSHAYNADYDLYEGFGRFEPGDWGYGLLTQQNQT